MTEKQDEEAHANRHDKNVVENTKKGKLDRGGQRSSTRKHTQTGRTKTSDTELKEEIREQT